jgi:hypothetical protein
VKTVLSISLGAASRDHTTKQWLLGQECQITRRGTDGDIAEAVALFRQHDGLVDAFGVGGIEFFLRVGERRWLWRDARRIRAAVTRSKIGDGNGVKGILERRALARLGDHLSRNEGRTLERMKVLQTSATERYELAEALIAAGCDCIFADFLFALGLPIPVRRLATVQTLARLILPGATRLPFSWLYPLGHVQDRDPRPKWEAYYRWADLIAGDFHQIRAHMPDDLSGKIIVTNTTTAQNVAELRRRNLHILVTTTPRFDGRTFGTNVIEATLLALMDTPQSGVTPADFAALIDRIPLEPHLQVLC